MPHLRFEVGGEPYALNIDSVAEVARALPMHWIPLVPLELGGAVNLRGEPLPAVVARALLGGASSGSASHLLVMESERRRIGFAVDRVTGIDRHVKTGPAVAEEVRPSSSLVTWVIGSPSIGVIEPEALFQRASEVLNPDPRALDVAQPGGDSEPCQARF